MVELFLFSRIIQLKLLFELFLNEKYNRTQHTIYKMDEIKKNNEKSANSNHFYRTHIYDWYINSKKEIVEK